MLRVNLHQSLWGMHSSMFSIKVCDPKAPQFTSESYIYFISVEYKREVWNVA